MHRCIEASVRGAPVAQGREDGDHVAIMQRVILDSGAPASHAPLAVLLNGGSASAAEILAGALHDNGRATLIGDRTFGKGKIQSVFELGDGSALFVTVAKYARSSTASLTGLGWICSAVLMSAPCFCLQELPR